MSSNPEVVKKAHIKTKMTLEQQQELVRCTHDYLHFITKYVKIQHPTKGIVPFEPYPFQLRIIDSFAQNRFTIALTARQMGKSLPLTTPILTPSGFKNMGDLKVGDTIYGEDGRATKINFITDTMYDHDCYKINFQHGETIVADAGHLWTVTTKTKTGWKEQTLDTVDLIALQEKQKAKGQAVSIPVGKAIQFAKRPEEDCIDFYSFGVWLGDGNSWDSRITSTKEDYEHYSSQISMTDFKLDKRSPKTGYARITDLDFRAFLIEQNLLKTDSNRDTYKKYIPHFMLMSSEENRMKLLRGLMDTDGTVEKNGVCRFYQSDEKFIDQVRFLLSGLGIKSTKRVKKTTHKNGYVLTFCTAKKVVSLPRKVDRLANLKRHPKNERFYISTIEKTESVPVRCLQVDNESHLFLAGKTLVPTHNTTVAAAFLLWKAMFVPNFKILIVANTYKQALEIMDRVRFAYENVPDFIRCGATEYNKGTVTFDNGSQITSRATSANSTRGLSVSMLYCDEFAFVSPRIANDFWTAARPVLATGGGCIITSTPKNDEDQFAQIWRAALDTNDDFGNPRPDGLGSNGFKAVKVTWREHPERDEAWARAEEAAIGKQKFLQEYNCEFVSDDETLISSLVLMGLRGRDPDFYTTTVRWYKEPKANRSYMVALDPSTGSGGDHAAIQVFEIDHGRVEQIAEWQHNQTPARGQMALMMNILKFLYSSLADDPDQEGEPEIFWTYENNSIGDTVLHILEDTGEENFPGILINEKRKKGMNGKRVKRGLMTDNRRKLAGCNRLKSLVESHRMAINSKNLLKEMKNFVASGASFKAKPGEHDDLVMSTVLISRMLDVVINYSLNEVSDLKESIDEDGDAPGDEDDMLPILV